MSSRDRLLPGRSSHVSVTITSLCVSMVIAGAIRASEPAKKPFTVADSIELTHIIPFSAGGDANPVAGTALFSPDGSQFVIHSRRGDLARNVNVEALLLFRTTDVETWLATPNEGERPVPKTIVQLEIADDRRKMSRIQWLSETEIGFIAQGDNGCNQAVVVDAATTRVSQLTRSSTDVASFAVAGDDVLYYTHLETPEERQVSAVGHRTLGEVIFPPDSMDTPMELLHASRSTGHVQRVDAPAVKLMEHFRQIWLSPDGRHAVTFTPAIHAAKHWADYQVPFYERFGYTPKSVRSDPTSPDLWARTRYQLIDLKANKARPLLDAPSGFLAFNRTPVEVFWPGNLKSVIVSNTYMPLDVKDPNERSVRRSQPAVAEIELQSGSATAITWEPVLSEAQFTAGARLEPIVSIDWDASAERLATTRKSAAGDVTGQYFERRGSRWRAVKVRDGQDQAAADLPAIDRRESLNERPKVYATGGKCACSKLLLDPNPQAEQFQFGQAEVFRWTDKNNIEWRGGLVLPPDLDHKQCYPLIIQTHGFRSDEFLIDGPGGATSAFAAQAFANAGFVVLQIEDSRQASTFDEHEASRFAEGYRAAVDELSAKGVVNSAKVGLIGFSRTVRHAIRLVADYPELIAAVTLSDGAWWGYLNDLLLLNFPQDVVTEVRKLSGGPPNEVGLAEWLARDPIYKLPRAKTAVRIEANGAGTVLGMWEMYAVLRNAGKPVDFIYFPGGSHVLMKPAQRIGSPGGNVDWFRFWLQGNEDPDPAKTEQYIRWRKLREQRDASAQVQGSGK